VKQRGRFAPSPTGALHLGSLVTALASWLDAKANGYAWLVRIEDLDEPRNEDGASELILTQLRSHRLRWTPWSSISPTVPSSEVPSTNDGVIFQSLRHSAYETALVGLIQRGLAYSCSCSRKRLQHAVEIGKTGYNPDGEILYPGFCRPSHAEMLPADEAFRLFRSSQQPGISWRFRNSNGDDFILKRADGFWAYNFAVVIDDNFQGITHIVRGDDLLHAAPRHAALRAALGFREPKLLHIPVMRNEQGEKLSKQSHALPLRTDHPEIIRLQLECAWSHLELRMPIGWVERVRAIWDRELNQPLKKGFF